MIRAFVTGWPVSHSLSPVLHGHWLRRYGIDGSYEAVPVAPADFAGFMAGLSARGWKGGNVTIPHKEAAFAACHELDDEARAIGAVNTLLVSDGRIHGSCTDALGFTASLDDAAPAWRASDEALLLGAGGAARAIVHALTVAGIGRIHIANRSVERAQRLAETFGAHVRAHGLDAADGLLPRCGLVVNSTPLGMGSDGGSPLSLAGARPGTIVHDAVYVPLETPLLAEARSRGLMPVDGLGMLLHQAVPGFEKWFGIRPVVDAQLRAEVLSELARRSGKS